jgi:hypothetical protein
MSSCMSEDHDQPIEATVTGDFVNVWNPAKNSRANYCDRCAAVGHMLGYFRPDPKAQK